MRSAMASGRLPRPHPNKTCRARAAAQSRARLFFCTYFPSKFILTGPIELARCDRIVVTLSPYS